MTDVEIRFTKEDYDLLRTTTEKMYRGKSNRYFSTIANNALNFHNESFSKKRELAKTGNVVLSSSKLPHGVRLKNFTEISYLLKRQEGYPELSQKNIINCINLVLKGSDPLKTIASYHELVLNLVDYRSEMKLYDISNFYKTLDEINKTLDRNEKESIWVIPVHPR